MKFQKILTLLIISFSLNAYSGYTLTEVTKIDVLTYSNNDDFE